VTSGKTSKLVVFDPEQATVLQQVELPSEEQRSPASNPAANNLQPDTKAIASFTGLLFSPDGKLIYLSNVQGSIKVFQVAEDGKVSPSHAIALPDANAPKRKQEIPSGLAFNEDATKLYVCGNLSNKLLEIQLDSGIVTRTWDVGVAPYDVRIAENTAIVSNWGGRRAAQGDLVGPAGKGTTVRVDPVRFIANEGSVSFVDLETSRIDEVIVGLHPSGLCISRDAKYAICANAGSDTLSVLDISKREEIEKIWTKTNPSELFGASPNALTFGADDDELFVANGTNNAIAVIEFEPEQRGASKLQGLIPVGWYPGAIAFDAKRNSLAVANIKGLPTEPRKQGNGSGFNSHQYNGSVSIVPVPSQELLPAMSERVARNIRTDAILRSKLPPREGQSPKAIPERIGEPSLIEHVVYIIKENRTFDQVFGDIGRGRANPELCIFGREITPNQHKLVDEFVLLDNAYCCGILSADGHQWSTTAFATDYLEKSFAGFPRSYPDGMEESDIDS
jgi:DNA-binding beta-propeller fold protein YncE